MTRKRYDAQISKRQATLGQRIVCALIVATYGSAYANPLDPTVISGQASFQQQGATLTVTNSPNAIINWQAFSIGASETTRFVQQSSASSVLNRVTGIDPSIILGSLQSNGQVLLLNPNGMLFGQGARIDVAGLVASTLNLSNDDYLNGSLNFTGGALAGSIKNEGAITTPGGGSVVLIAPDITNSGLITAPDGNVILAAGHSVRLGDTTAPNVLVEISAPDTNAVNLGQIVVGSGKVGIYAGIIQQKGIVSADAVSTNAAGKIVFKATKDVTLDSGSRTTANGASGGQILVQAETGTNLISGVVEAKGLPLPPGEGGGEGKGGGIQLLGTQVAVAGNAVVDASGSAGGGQILVGGDYKGQNAAIQNARATYFGGDAKLIANATDTGSGGRIILWSDEVTRAYGQISAKGGANGGNGGFVETSSKGHLDVTRAPEVGAGGLWLLDPTDITIQATTGSIDLSGPPIFSSTVASSTVSNSVINAALNAGTGVTVTTNSTAPQLGSITINTDAPIIKSTGVNATLTLIADNDIVVSGAITDASGNGLNVAMFSGQNGATSTGDVTMFGGMNTGKGSFSANKDVSLFNSNYTIGGLLNIQGKLTLGTNAALNLGYNATNHQVVGNIFLDPNLGGSLTLKGLPDATFGSPTLEAAGGITISDGDSSGPGVVVLDGLIVFTPASTGQVSLNTHTLTFQNKATLNTAKLNITSGLIEGSGSLSVNTDFTASGGSIQMTKLPSGTAPALYQSDVYLTSQTNSSLPQISVRADRVEIHAAGSTSAINVAAVNTSVIANHLVLTQALGNLSITAPLFADRIELTASNGSILDAHTGGPEIVAKSTRLQAAGSIGTAIDRLDTSVEFLDADTTLSAAGSGGIYVANTLKQLHILGAYAGANDLSITNDIDIRIGRNVNDVNFPSVGSVGGDIVIESTAGNIGNYAGATFPYDVPARISANVLKPFTGAPPGNAGTVTLIASGNIDLPTSLIEAKGSDHTAPGAGGQVVLQAGGFINVATVDARGGNALTGGATDVAGGNGGSINLTGGSINFAGAATLMSAAGASIGVPPLPTNGNVNLTAGSGGILQAGALSVDTPQFTFNSVGNVALGHAANNFPAISGAVTGGNLLIADSTNLNTGNLSASGNVDVTMNATNGVFNVNGTVTAGGNINLSAPGANANLNINNQIIRSNAAAVTTAILRASNNIMFNSGADIVTVGTGAQNVFINSDLDSNGAGGIRLGSGTVISSNGGNIVLGGGADPANSAAVGALQNEPGIQLDNAQLISGAGSISLRGQSGNGFNSGKSGLHLLNGSLVQSTTGNISIAGTANNSSGSGGIGGSVNGILLDGLTTKVTSADGNINLTGTHIGVGTSGFNQGLKLTGAVVESTGSGNIVLNGTGGAGVQDNYGIFISGGGKAISTSASGGGSITLNGISGAGTGGSNYGAYLIGAGSRINSASGNISLSGNSLAVGTGFSNRGVVVDNGAEIISSGPGSISVTGTGAGTSGGSSYGVIVQGTGTLVNSQGTGSLGITGTANGTGSAENGIQIAAGALIQTNAGNITISGVSNATGAAGFSRGLYLVSNADIVSVGAGNINISGTGADSTGTSNYGIYVDGNGSSISSQGTGHATLNGVARGSTIESLYIANSSNITSNGGITTTNLFRVSAGSTVNLGGPSTIQSFSMDGGSVNGQTGSTLIVTDSFSHTGGVFGAGANAFADIDITQLAGNLTLINMQATNSFSASAVTGNLTINGQISANSVNLDVSGTTTQGAGTSILANTLNLSGTGSHTLANTVNNVSILNGNTGGVVYTDADSLSIGALSSSGNVLVDYGAGGPDTATLTGSLTLSTGTFELRKGGLPGTGTLLSDGSAVLDRVTFADDLALSGIFNVANGLYLANAVTVNMGGSQLHFNSGAAQNIAVQGGVGNAIINIAGGNIVAGAGGAGTVQIDAGVTLQGYGALSQGAVASIINNGSIISNTVGQTFTINPNNFTNNGVLGVSAGTMNVAAANFTQSGTINVPAGATFRKTGGFTNAAAGIVSGSGTVDVGAGNTFSNNGTVRPGGAGIAGTLNITGNLANSPTGVIEVDIGGPIVGTQYDRLNVSGSVTLGGTLNGALFNGFVPNGQNFDIIAAAAMNGSFTSSNLPVGVNGAILGGIYRLTHSGGTCTGVCWDGGAGTALWSDALNWTTDLLPGTNDLVQLNLVAGVTVDHTIGNDSIRGLNSIANNNLIISGGSITLNDPATTSTLLGALTLSGGVLTNNGNLNTSALNLSAGTLGGTGALNANGVFNWAGGSLAGTGLLTTNGASTISGGGGTLNKNWSNNATVDLQGTTALSVGSGNSFTNAAAGVFSVNGTNANPIGGAGTFLNQGTLNKNNAVTQNFTANLTNSGTVNVNAGTLALNNGDAGGGTYNIAAPGVLALGGAGATYTIGQIADAGTLNVGAGTLNVGSLTGPGAFNVSGGTANLAGANHTGVTTVNGGALNVQSGQFNTVNVGGGAVNVSGALTAQNLNLTAGSVTGPGDLTVSFNFQDGGGTFGTNFLNLDLTRQGLFTVAGYDAVNSLSLRAAGDLAITNQTLDAPIINLSGTNVLVNSSMVGSAATASLTVNATGAFDVTAGAIAAEVMGNTVSVNANTVTLRGGTGVDAYAAIEGRAGGTTVTALTAINLFAGTGQNADAVILAGNGLPNVSANCTGCTVLLEDPFTDPLTNVGIFDTSVSMVPVDNSIIYAATLAESGGEANTEIGEEEEKKEDQASNTEGTKDDGEKQKAALPVCI
jgi:filamentous hemagglutinin family protein